MMSATIMTIAGRLESALTHFAGLGVAAILSEESDSPARLRWTDEVTPKLQLQVAQSNTSEVAEAVLRHAERSSITTSWVQARIAHEGKAGVGLFSPRIKPPSSRESWHALEERRRSYIAAMENDAAYLDLDMIEGLGEPAYWRFDNKDPRPDHGASRWEMKARNRGEEFVGNRLSAMARALSQRSAESIELGLAGEVVVDDLGSGASSQTATGFQRPGEVDTALAWCGLWGMASFPVVHDAHGHSLTACAFPTAVLHSRWMVLPVSSSWMSINAFRDVLISAHLARSSTAILPGGTAPEADVLASRNWLQERNVDALMRFNIKKIGSSSAPQRIVLDGELMEFGEQL